MIAKFDLPGAARRRDELVFLEQRNLRADNRAGYIKLSSPMMTTMTTDATLYSRPKQRKVGRCCQVLGNDDEQENLRMHNRAS